MRHAGKSVSVMMDVYASGYLINLVKRAAAWAQATSSRACVLCGCVVLLSACQTAPHAFVDVAPATQDSQQENPYLTDMAEAGYGQGLSSSEMRDYIFHEDYLMLYNWIE